MMTQMTFWLALTAIGIVVSGVAAIIAARKVNRVRAESLRTHGRLLEDLKHTHDLLMQQTDRLLALRRESDKRTG